MARSLTALSIRARRGSLAPSFAALAASALGAVAARGDPPPLRIDYQAAPGCPGADVFLDEIRWRTSLARAALPGEEALTVRARIARRGAVSSGRLVLGQGEARITRDIEGERCDEVVSALALVTALAVDPRASMGAKRPAAEPAPAEARAPPPAPPGEPPPAASLLTAPRGLPAPSILADPLPVIPTFAAPLAAGGSTPGPRWVLGARTAVASAIVPRLLVGGGLFADRALEGRSSPSLRLSVEAAGTGGFDAGPGGAWFLRGIGRVEGCAFAARPAPWLSLVPCIGVEGGALHAEGILRGSLAYVAKTTIFWLGAGVLPRIGVALGSVIIDLQGGPIFPAVRRSFVFESPAYLIATLPPVTWTVALGAGVHFP